MRYELRSDEAATSVRVVSRSGEVTSVRQAAAVCDMSPPVIRRWLSLGLITGPPWTVEQLQKVRDLTDPDGRRRGNRAAHGTITRWNAGVAALSAADSKATTPGHAGDARHKYGSLLMYASSS
jgi:hypothetical protein